MKLPYQANLFLLALICVCDNRDLHKPSQQKHIFEIAASDIAGWGGGAELPLEDPMISLGQDGPDHVTIP